MRKIIESTLVSLDGVIGAPHLWAGEYFDKEAQQQALEQLQERVRAGLKVPDVG